MNSAVHKYWIFNRYGTISLTMLILFGWLVMLVISLDGLD